MLRPFFGFYGYAVRYSARKVVLVERDPQIAGVWRYLLRATPAEIRRIPDVPMDGSVDDLPSDLPQEGRWLVGFWLNRAPSRPRRSPSAWMRSGVRPGAFWGERVRETIASQVDAIRHWRLIEGDYSEAPDIVATWFVDPPYKGAGRHYHHGPAGIDYASLGAWCRARRGAVIACEAGGADWLPFRPLRDIKTTRPGARAIESVWTGENP